MPGMRLLRIVLTIVKKNSSKIIAFILVFCGYLLLKSCIGYFIYSIERFSMENLKRKDWHDYSLINEEKIRIGTGEKGMPAKLPKEKDQLKKELYAINGYNAALSDQISLNRSLPDLRHHKCKERLYLETLPSCSVIITFNSEHLSVLLRAVYSVLNRSPKHLIKEVFLVDDGSTKEFFKDELHYTVNKHLPKVKVIHLRSRRGIVTARLAGAKAATAEVLVFIESHSEVNVNWLPPLLEPIALNYRTVVTPLTDVIKYDTFQYCVMDDGARGAFTWDFVYTRIPMLPKDRTNLPDPFDTPVLMGGHLAISRKYFWELGGYDPGMEIWGGEQYELSFKIWQCGGRILEVPCSRVGHLFREFNPPGFEPKKGNRNYIARNFRRVAVVWMDEYAEYLYLRRQGDRTVDPGDISERKAIREKLKCKPFKWYMTQIAFDFSQQFPLIDPMPYAEGRIRPVLSPGLCVDGNHGKEEIDSFVLKPCSNMKVKPCKDDQKFVLTYYNDVRLKSRPVCWQASSIFPGSHLMMYPCHRGGGNQQWRYLQKKKNFLFGNTICLDHNPENMNLFLNFCHDYSETQLFVIDFVNEEQMKKWNASNTIRVTGPVESWTE